MNVFFGTTTAQWQKHKNNYFAINNYLKDIGCIIKYDWLKGADKYYQTDYKERNIREIYRDVISAIDDADAVVIEYTVPNFSSSHQINYSLIKKKPTLVMRLNKDNPRFNDSYLEAFESPYLTVREYTINNFREVIDEFFGVVEMGMGHSRYNIVLDKKHKHYLDWASTKYKQSRSEIIRGLIDKRVAGDTAYRKYINS